MKIPLDTHPQTIIVDDSEYTVRVVSMDFHNRSLDFEVYLQHGGINEQIADGDYFNGRVESTADLGEDLWTAVECALIDIAHEIEDW